jgi:DNA-binding PadR family transcriptional regulator
MTDELTIWEIAVLALLREGPMHPYQMQRLLHLRHKDEILALKRGSLYHAIRRLLHDKLIDAKSTGREGRRPERTTYAITSAGRKELSRNLRQMIAVPRHESSDFMAAMSFIVHLTPAESLQKLEDRSKILEQEIVARGAGMAAAAKHVLRINLVESEYLVAMLKAELMWVRNLSLEISTGRLTWDLKNVLKGARESVEAAAQRKE